MDSHAASLRGGFTKTSGVLQLRHALDSARAELVASLAVERQADSRLLVETRASEDAITKVNGLTHLQRCGLLGPHDSARVDRIYHASDFPASADTEFISSDVQQIPPWAVRIEKMHQEAQDLERSAAQADHRLRITRHIRDRTQSEYHDLLVRTREARRLLSNEVRRQRSERRAASARHRNAQREGRQPPVRYMGADAGAGTQATSPASGSTLPGSRLSRRVQRRALKIREKEKQAESDLQKQRSAQLRSRTAIELARVAEARWFLEPVARALRSAEVPAYTLGLEASKTKNPRKKERRAGFESGRGALRLWRLGASSVHSSALPVGSSRSSSEGAGGQADDRVHGGSQHFNRAADNGRSTTTHRPHHGPAEGQDQPAYTDQTAQTTTLAGSLSDAALSSSSGDSDGSPDSSESAVPWQPDQAAADAAMGVLRSPTGARDGRPGAGTPGGSRSRGVHFQGGGEDQESPADRKGGDVASNPPGQQGSLRPTKSFVRRGWAEAEAKLRRKKQVRGIVRSALRKVVAGLVVFSQGKGKGKEEVDGAKADGPSAAGSRPTDGSTAAAVHAAATPRVLTSGSGSAAIVAPVKARPTPPARARAPRNRRGSVDSGLIHGVAGTGAVRLAAHSPAISRPEASAWAGRSSETTIETSESKRRAPRARRGSAAAIVLDAGKGVGEVAEAVEAVAQKLRELPRLRRLAVDLGDMAAMGRLGLLLRQEARDRQVLQPDLAEGGTGGTADQSNGGG